MEGREIQVPEEEFLLLRDLVHAHFGIWLGPAKRSLLENRLQRLLRQHNFSTFRQYREWLTADRNLLSERLGELADRISTNHTFFYREPQHFDLFTQTILPWAESRNAAEQKVRVWCAAASSGQEPYTLSLLMQRYFGAKYSRWDAGVLATDISAEALERAAAGLYEAQDVEALPPQLRELGFRKTDSGQYAATEALRRDLTFRRYNLLHPIPFRSKFDVIFCRNVMIYFQEQTRLEIVQRMYDALVPGGYFLVSLSESLSRTETQLEYLQPGVYRRPLGNGR